MTPQATGQPGAGWYAQGDGQLRYWDGQSWTAHTAAALAGPTPPAGSSSAVSGLAVVTLLLCFVPYLGALALVTGSMALKSIKRNGQRGRIPVIIGMTVGGLWLAAFVMAMVAAGIAGAAGTQ